MPEPSSELEVQSWTPASVKTSVVRQVKCLIGILLTVGVESELEACQGAAEYDGVGVCCWGRNERLDEVGACNVGEWQEAGLSTWRRDRVDEVEFIWMRKWVLVL